MPFVATSCVSSAHTSSPREFGTDLSTPAYVKHDTSNPGTVALSGSMIRPGWMCDLIHQRYDPNESSVPSAVDTEEGLADVVNPYSRLTGPSEDLSRELRDRPLLLLFRFVRFRRCFVTNGDGSDPNLFVEASQTIFLVGQVVAYRTCDSLSFVTPSGAALQPT